MIAVTVTNETQKQTIALEQAIIKETERWRIRLPRGKKEPIFILVNERDASVVKRSTESEQPILFVDRVGLSRWQSDSGYWRYRLVDERFDRYYPKGSALIRLIIDSGTDDTCEIRYDSTVEVISVQTYTQKESRQRFTRSEALAVLRPRQCLFAERHGSGIKNPYGMIMNIGGNIKVVWETSEDDLPAQLGNH